MKFNRAGGILLHPSSLPGKFGIGDLGPEAYKFIDKLHRSGCRLWQVLPLGPCGYGNSPYQCFSAFAGNPLLISPELLVQDGLLDEDDLEVPVFGPKNKVNYPLVITWKNNLLRNAFDNFLNNKNSWNLEFQAFCDQNKYWLENYSLFMAIKEHFGGGSWVDWPDSIKTCQIDNIKKYQKLLEKEIRQHEFFQYIFYKQWSNLHSYCQEKEIKIIGDLPLFVSQDSVEIWKQTELFVVDENKQPTFVAGVPPDYFSPTGQLWGNPVYDWIYHRSTGFEWWINRIKYMMNSVDFVRLDHFRGFLANWNIPIGNQTAEIGEWKPGPGKELFDAIKRILYPNQDLPFIAEDLGIITDDVNKLKEELNLPGMEILQFAFSDPDTVTLPISTDEHVIVYSGTHDNDTTKGWFKTASEYERKSARKYTRGCKGTMAWKLIQLGWSTKATFAIAPMQDFLSLDSRSRMNYPGRSGGNWEWRMKEDQFSQELIDRIYLLNSNSNRLYSS